MKIKGEICIFIVFLSLFAGVGKVSAENSSSTVDVIVNPVEIHAIKSTNGASISSFADAFKIIFSAKSASIELAATTTIIAEEIKQPWRLEKLSKIYQFELSTTTPIKLEIAYEETSNYLKTVYFFDKTKNIWRPLPTKDLVDKKIAQAEINLPFARVAVFADPDILMIGKSSWYKYKTGDYAASPDFPKGAKLRVYNLDNEKFVDVEVNDFGPERNLFPDRVIDLEKTAFAKIASVKSGIIKVRVEYLGMVDKKTNKLQVAGIKIKSEETDLNAKTKSAIIVNEETGEILYDKKSSSSSPLASLTKLVAVKTFLDTKPTLNTIVKYSTQDEKYNFQFVEHAWESARVKLKDEETLSIEDLLYSALVGSANNAVESLVRVSGLKRADFIDKMNKNVVLWGATSTHFIEPTGLSPQNVSSPYDYAIITKEVFKNPIIQKASAMGVYKFTTKSLNKKHTLRNTNSLVESNKFKITGSKTGYLHEAGYCLMTRAKADNGQQIIVVTFGAKTKAESVAETKNLLYYGLKQVNDKI